MATARRAPVVDAQHHQGGVESRPPLRPTGVFLAVVRRRARHRRAPGGANVDGLQAVAPHPPGQVAHAGARRVANRGGAHRALQHGGEAGADALVRDGPQLRFLCRPGRWSTRLKLQRPPEGSAQVDGKVAKIDLAARGGDGALVQFNAPSWAVRAVMSSTTLPVCPKTGSTSPSLTVHLCLHTAPGNRECALFTPFGQPGGIQTLQSSPAVVWAGYLGVAWGAILVGGLEWLLLRRHVARAIRWVLACFGAVAVVGVVVFGVGAFDADAGWVAGTGIFGTVAGVFQWLVLKGQVPRAGWWVLASTVGWVVGIPVGEELGWNGLGAGYGLITGMVLVLLLRQKSRGADHSRQSP